MLDNNGEVAADIEGDIVVVVVGNSCYHFGSLFLNDVVVVFVVVVVVVGLGCYCFCSDSGLDDEADQFELYHCYYSLQLSRSNVVVMATTNPTMMLAKPKSPVVDVIYSVQNR